MSIEDTLRTFLDESGVVGVALVDAVTGLVHGTVGHAPDGEDCSRFTVLVDDRLQSAGARGSLESIVVTGTHHQVVLRLLGSPGDPLLLAAALEREHANLALLTRCLDRCAADVLR